MVLASQFQAPWWLRNPHLQTLFAATVRKINKPPVRNERLETPDGDFLDLHWFGEQQGPLVIIFHGLEGCSDSNYVRGLMRALTHAKLGGAVMHFRGCSGEANRKRQSYHCGHTVDIAWTLNKIALTHPKQQLCTVGFSIGGAALLNSLAQERLPKQLIYSLVVSPPFEPRSGANRMNKGFSQLYQRFLVKDCVKAAKAKIRAGIDLGIDLEQLEKAKTFWQFDHHVTAPLHGFGGADDYYNRAAPRQRLKQIERSCHIIHALDDPFFEQSMIPKADELGENTILELCQHGGHVGFVTGSFWKPNFWLENRLLQLISQKLKEY